jgi:hypothetical protein
MVCDVIVLGHSRKSEVQEVILSSGYMNLDGIGRDGLGDEHVVVGHDDAVSGIKSALLSLEEIVRIVKMNTLLPPLSGFLVTLKLWVMRDEDSLFMVSVTLQVQICGVAGGAPCKIEDVTLKILPRVTEIFGDVQLLVNFTRLIVSKVGAGCPAGCKGPGSLLWMVVELMDSLARVQGSQISATVFCHPINTIGASKHDKIIVDGTLHHLLYLSDVLEIATK